MGPRTRDSCRLLSLVAGAVCVFVVAWTLFENQKKFPQFPTHQHRQR